MFEKVLSAPLFLVSNSLADNYMFKVNNRKTRTMCEICSKLTLKTPKRRFIGVIRFIEKSGYKLTSEEPDDLNCV